jgi:hypothetical protein
MFKYILSLLLSFSASPHDVETAKERKVRMSVVAMSIVYAANRVAWPLGAWHMARTLTVHGYYESRYARHIHFGRCKPKECDNGKARGLWQLHEAAARPLAWWMMGAASEIMTSQDLLGVTEEPAFRAAAALSTGAWRCINIKGANWLEGAFAGAAVGHGCKWSGAAKRIRTIRRL